MLPGLVTFEEHGANYKQVTNEDDDDDDDDGPPPSRSGHSEPKRAPSRDYESRRPDYYQGRSNPNAPYTPDRRHWPERDMWSSPAEAYPPLPRPSAYPSIDKISPGE